MATTKKADMTATASSGEGRELADADSLASPTELSRLWAGAYCLAARDATLGGGKLDSSAVPADTTKLTSDAWAIYTAASRLAEAGTTCTEQAVASELQRIGYPTKQAAAHRAFADAAGLENRVAELAAKVDALPEPHGATAVLAIRNHGARPRVRADVTFPADGGRIETKVRISSRRQFLQLKSCRSLELRHAEGELPPRCQL